MKAHKQEPDLRANDDSRTSADEYELLTAAEAASVLRVARKFVYANAKELGGFRLLGDRGPWRFQRRQLLVCVLSAPEPVLPRRSHARSSAASGKPTHTPNGAPILPSEPREPVTERERLMNQDDRKLLVYPGKNAGADWRASSEHGAGHWRVGAQ